jgi:hypothetical protein
MKTAIDGLVDALERGSMRPIVDIAVMCEFRRNPAGDSDLIPAGVPI